MRGFAVIDTETTGLNIWGNDRIIEIAVVLIDPNLNITGKYETILHPHRDLGLVSLHGIDGLMASHGAEFAEIAGSLSSILHERIIVAHNSGFDTRILIDEYKRIGIVADLGDPIDTISLAKGLPNRFPSYKLENLCDYFGIQLEHAHTAGADALATAELFITLVQLAKRQIYATAATFESASAAGDSTMWKPRRYIETMLSAPADLKHCILTLPDDESRELPQKSIDTYLSTMHKLLLNNRYSFIEKAIMENMISKLALTRMHVIDLNEEYIFMLLCKYIANNDGSWPSSPDTSRLETVMGFTGVEESRVQELLDQTLQNRHFIEPTVNTLNGYFNIEEGDAFAVSGEDFEYSQQHWEELLVSKGLILKKGTTKLTKLVVANDPYSLSAKAAKARSYGIPVLSEKTMMELLIK